MCGCGSTLLFNVPHVQQQDERHRHKRPVNAERQRLQAHAWHRAHGRGQACPHVVTAPWTAGSIRAYNKCSGHYAQRGWRILKGRACKCIPAVKSTDPLSPSPWPRGRSLPPPPGRMQVVMWARGAAASTQQAGRQGNARAPPPNVAVQVTKGGCPPPPPQTPVCCLYSQHPQVKTSSPPSKRHPMSTAHVRVTTALRGPAGKRPTACQACAMQQCWSPPPF